MILERIICWFWGHLPMLYNAGTDVDPEEGCCCSFCGKDLGWNTKDHSLYLCRRITKYFANRKKTEFIENKLPF